jgi:hypothetical protein
MFGSSHRNRKVKAKIKKVKAKAKVKFFSTLISTLTCLILGSI